MKRKAILQFVILLVLVGTVTAAVLHVPADYPNINSAVEAADNGDEIILADGIYTGDGNHEIFIDRDITIRSENGPDNCIIDCNDPGPKPEYNSAFEIMFRRFTLEGLSIINGKGHPNGGAICNYGSRCDVINVINCIFAYNSSETGGAISLYNPSRANILNCRFMDNTAQKSGGAICCRYGTFLTVMNSEFINNSTGENSSVGGAIACGEGCQITLMDSKLEGNSAHSAGGAIFCRDNSDLIIDECLISDNSVHGDSEVRGAGVYIESNRETTVSITNTMITHNVVTASGEGSGGGLYLKLHDVDKNGQVIIKNCTIIDNLLRVGYGYRDRLAGAGIYIEGEYESSIGSVVLEGCVISRNQVGDPNYPFSYSQGGGLFCRRTRPILLKCRIQGNTANAGSGMYFYESAPVISNCLISSNRAKWLDTKTGSVFFENPLPGSVVVNSTIVGNASYGIDCRSNLAPKIHNCILYYNHPRYYRPYRYDEQINGDAEVTYSCVQTCEPSNPPWPGEGNINTDPCFVIPGYWDSNGTKNLEDDFWVEGDYHLKADSNCIDAGGTPIWYMDTKDLDGLSRISGPKIDMGVYEYHNTAPIAIAGPNQVIYACIDDLVDVTLDGSASHDDDNDTLTYTWLWTIDNNQCEANSVAPTISLPVRTHSIELIVHDGKESSEPDCCVAEVIAPVEGELLVMPRTINCRSHGNWITVMLTLPAAIKPADIAEKPLKLYPGGISSIYQRPIIRYSDKKVTVFAVFEKRQFCEAVEANGRIEVKTAGELISGRCFYGMSFVRVFQ